MRLLDLLTDPRTPLVLAAVVAFLRVLYALVSRIVAPYPRARAVVEGVAALGPDVVRSVLQLYAAYTGRPAPRLDVLPGGDPHATIAELLTRANALTSERDALARRVAELTAGAEPGTLRPTVVPGEEPARSPDETTAAMRETTSRHRIRGAV